MQFQPKVYGLFTVGPGKTLPLKKLNITVDILNSVARIEYKQVYLNDTGNLVETEFYFPVAPTSCFDSFTAEYKGVKIKGVIKEKEQAKEEYKQALNKGKVIAYAEQVVESPDIMKMQIGNIPPNEEVAITLSYIEKLEVAMNKFWCFKLYSTITKRYNPSNNVSSEEVAKLSDYPYLNSFDQNAFPWDIKISIQSAFPITFIKSPSHKIVTKFSNENHCCEVTFNPSMKYYPNKDFVLYFENGNENRPDYVLSALDDGYCAMLTFMPQFEKIKSEEAFESLAKAKTPDFENDMSKIRGEFIFLIDRSGSMAGDRMEMAKKALIMFLKSLPVHSKYNIISFGSRAAFMYTNSVDYSSTQIKHTISKVQNFAANMGGTEIFEPLKEALMDPLVKNYPRTIFILTDGAIMNLGQVLKLINENSDRARIFTIGVGNGCSPELITKAAHLGKGAYEFVSDGSDAMGKVLGLLNAALTPCCDDFQLEIENSKDIVMSISPDPAALPYILRNQAVTFFIFFNKKIEDMKTVQAKLTMFDTSIDRMREFSIEIDLEKAEKNELIPKLAVNDMVKRMEHASKLIKKDNPDIYFAEKTDNHQKLLELSLRYGVLSDRTAFICNITEESVDNQNIPKEKVLVPTIESVDYETQIDGQERFKSISPVTTFRTVDRSGMSYDREPRIQMCSLQRKNAAGGCCAGGGGGTSYSSPLMEAAPKKNIKSADGFIEVIAQQSIEGYWDESAKDELPMVVIGNMNNIPKEIPNNNLSKPLWITILVLCWLEKNFNDKKDSWVLIHKKAVQWLSSQGIKFEDLKSKAMHYI